MYNYIYIFIKIKFLKEINNLRDAYRKKEKHNKKKRGNELGFRESEDVFLKKMTFQVQTKIQRVWGRIF